MKCLRFFATLLLFLITAFCANAQNPVQLAQTNQFTPTQATKIANAKAIFGATNCAVIEHQEVDQYLVNGKFSLNLLK